MKRVIFDVAIFILLFIAPWWIGLILLLLGIFIFSDYYEFIIGLLIIFSVYSIPGNEIFHSPVFFSAVTIVIYVLIQLLKNNIILYKK